MRSQRTHNVWKKRKKEKKKQTNKTNYSHYLLTSFSPFSICSCMMRDWVLSKPWLALLGVISAGLSLLSVFGLLSAVGVKSVPQVGLVPFLILGEYIFAKLIVLLFVVFSWKSSKSLIWDQCNQFWSHWYSYFWILGTLSFPWIATFH